METVTKILVAGGVATVVLAASHRHDSTRGRHRHLRGSCGGRGHRHGHGHGRFGGAEWQGLTEAEARAKLVDQLDDPALVDEAIDELDTRGLLDRGEPT